MLKLLAVHYRSHLSLFENLRIHSDFSCFGQNHFPYSSEYASSPEKALQQHSFPFSEAYIKDYSSTKLELIDTKKHGFISFLNYQQKLF